MSSPPSPRDLNGLLDEWMPGATYRPDVMALFEPYREAAERLMDDFDEETQSWRDYAPCIWGGRTASDGEDAAIPASVIAAAELLLRGPRPEPHPSHRFPTPGDVAAMAPRDQPFAEGCMGCACLPDDEEALEPCQPPKGLVSAVPGEVWRSVVHLDSQTAIFAAVSHDPETGLTPWAWGFRRQGVWSSPLIGQARASILAAFGLAMLKRARRAEATLAKAGA